MGTFVPQTWPVHPAAELFPLVGEEELRELAADINERGLLEPVWLYRDAERGEVLLDGRNRLAACTLIGRMVETRWYTGSDPIGFSLSQNLQRRHLTAGQKAAIALKVLPLYEAEAAKRYQETVGRPTKGEKSGADLHQISSPEPKPKRAPRSCDRAAKATGASGRAVAQMKRISEQAPDLAAKVEDGSMALDRAERIIRDREAEQRRIEQARRDAEAQEQPSTVDIRLGDFREVLADLQDIDAIITDPPYPAEFLPLLGDLAAWADKVLKPNGVLAVLIGQTHLPEVYRLLDGHRPYRWTACYLTAGAGYVSHPRRVQSNWKPLLVYGGGPRFADTIHSEGINADSKNNHRWGQDYQAFHTIIERLTNPGQTVVDPFMGSGTTLLAARALGRHAIGADVDETSVETSRQRLDA